MPARILPVLVKSSQSVLGLNGVCSRLRTLGYSSPLRSVHLPLQKRRCVHALVLSSVYWKPRLLRRAVPRAGSGKGSSDGSSGGKRVLILPFPTESSSPVLRWCVVDTRCGFASATEMSSSRHGHCRVKLQRPGPASTRAVPDTVIWQATRV